MGRLRIGIDARMCWSGGIGRYVRNIINSLLRVDTDDTFVILINPEAPPGSPPTRSVVEAAARVWDWIEGGENLEIACYRDPLPPMSLKEQAWLPAWCRERKLDLLHVPHFNAPLAVRQQPLVVSIHDVTYLRSPQSARGALRGLGARWLLRQSARRARLVLTGTEAARSDLVEDLGIEPGRIRVVLHGADEFLDVPQARELGCLEAPKFDQGMPFGYLLHVGNHRPHKGVERLLRALAELRGREDPRVASLTLVLAGLDEPWTRDLRALAGSLGLDLGNHVIFGDRVGDPELRWLYANAKALILPSREEGFGLTALEAAAAGCPVVASGLPAVREVMSEDGAHWISPGGSASELADAIADVITNDDLRARLARRGRARALKLRWKRAAEETLACYEEALGLREPEGVSAP